MAVLRGFPAQNIVAIFDEPNQSGAKSDIDAPRNAPAKDPAAFPSLVYWHIDFFQYELALPIQTVNVSHPALSGRQKFWGEASRYDGNSGIADDFLKYVVNGRVASTEHTLVNHGLGYEPLAFVAYNGRMLMPGVAAQTASQGRNRFISPFVTTSIVGLREVYNASENSLGAVSREYQIMVFRTPAVDAERALFGREGASVVLGRGKVDTSHAYLRRNEPGESSQFNLDQGRTVDINNGRSRIVSGGVTTTEAGYGGSFSGPSFVPVNV